jgi:hypothetical protein
MSMPMPVLVLVLVLVLTLMPYQQILTQLVGARAMIKLLTLPLQAALWLQQRRL